MMVKLSLEPGRIFKSFALPHWAANAHLYFFTLKPLALHVTSSETNFPRCPLLQYDLDPTLSFLSATF